MRTPTNEAPREEGASPGGSDAALSVSTSIGRLTALRFVEKINGLPADTGPEGIEQELAALKAGRFEVLCEVLKLNDEAGLKTLVRCIPYLRSFYDQPPRYISEHPVLLETLMISPNPEEAIPTLIQMLDYDPSCWWNLPVNEFAVDALVRLGKKAIPALVEAMKERENVWKFSNALEALSLIARDRIRRSDVSPTDEAVAVTIREASIIHMRGAGARALRNVGAVTEEVVPALIGMLQSGCSDTRYFACCALRDIGKDAADASDALIQMLSSEALSMCVVEALHALGHIGPVNPAVIPTLSRYAVRRTVGSPPEDARTRQASIESLGQIGRLVPNSAIDILIDALDSSHSYERCAAAVALGRIGARSAKALNKLGAIRDVPVERHMDDERYKEKIDIAIRKIQSALV